MAGEVLAISDSDLYMVKQPGKATAPTNPFRTALRFTSVQATTTLQGVDGEAGLGLGLYSGKAIGLSFKVDWNAKARLSLGTMPGFIFDYFCTRATTGVAAPYVHRYNPIKRNYNLGWYMLGIVYGEGDVRGSGLATRYFRDARLASLSFSLSAADIVRFEMQGNALNYGKGEGTETFEADTTENVPAPVNPSGNSFTFPTTLLPDNTDPVCINSIDFKWTPDLQLAPPCLGSGEMGGMVITTAKWDVTFNLRGDEVAFAMAERVNTKKADAASIPTGYAALDPSYLEGTFAFAVKSINNMGPNSPLNVPYEFRGSFPLQYRQATFQTDQTPNTVVIQAVTYTDTWYLEVKNDVAGADMSL